MLPNQLTNSGWISGYLEFDKAFIELPAPNHLLGNFWAELFPKTRIPFQAEKPFAYTVQQMPVPWRFAFSHRIKGIKYNFRISIVHGAGGGSGLYTYPGVDGAGYIQANDGGVRTLKSGIQVEMFAVAGNNPAVTASAMYKWVSVNLRAKGNLGYQGREGVIDVDVTETFTETYQFSKLKRVKGGISVLLCGYSVYGSLASTNPNEGIRTAMAMFVDARGDGEVSSRWYTVHQSGMATRYGSTIPARSYGYGQGPNPTPGSPESYQQVFASVLNPYQGESASVRFWDFHIDIFMVVMMRGTYMPNTGLAFSPLVPVALIPPNALTGTNLTGLNRVVATPAGMGGVFILDEGGSYPGRATYIKENIPVDGLGYIPYPGMDDVEFTRDDSSVHYAMPGQFPSTITNSFEYVDNDAYNLSRIQFVSQAGSDTYTRVAAHFDGTDTITAQYSPDIIHNSWYTNYSQWSRWKTDQPFAQLPSVTAKIILLPDDSIIGSNWDTMLLAVLEKDSYISSGSSVSSGADMVSSVHSSVYFGNNMISQEGDTETFIRTVVYDESNDPSTRFDSAVYTITSEQTFDEEEAISWLYRPAAITVGIPNTAAGALTTGWKGYIPDFEAGDEIEMEFEITNSLGTYKVPFKLVFDSDETAFQPELAL